MALATLVANQPVNFVLTANASYPPMNCDDMYFWKIGYELDMTELLRQHPKNPGKNDPRDNVYNKAKLELFELFKY